MASGFAELRAVFAECGPDFSEQESAFQNQIGVNAKHRGALPKPGHVTAKQKDASAKIGAVITK